MRALKLHLRTCSVRWALPPLVALTLTVLLLRSRYWVGLWSETGAAGQIPAFFLSIFAAGAAAWTSGQRVRHRLEEQLAAAAITSVKLEANRFAAVLILVLVPYMIGQAVAFGFTALTFPVGVGLWLGYAAMGVLLIVLATAWGWALGRLLSPTYAALTAVLSWLFFETFPGDRAALSVVSGPLELQPDLGALAVRSTAAAVLVAAVLWAPTPSIRWHAPFAWSLAPLVGGAVVVAAVVNTSGVSERSAPADPLCVLGTIEICLWPEAVKYVTVVRAVDGKVATLPAGFRTPSRLNQYGLKREEYTHKGRTFTQLEGFDISEGRRSALASAVSSSIIEATLRGCDLDAIWQAEDSAPEALGRWLQYHLDGSKNPESADGAPQGFQEAWSTAFLVSTQLTQQEQREWAQEQLSHIQTTYCD